MTVHVVGNACLDLVFGLAALPRPGETAVAYSLASDVGGKGANQARAAARTGAPTRLHVALGEDAAGDRIRAVLAREPGLTSHCVRLTSATDCSVVFVEPSGENRIVSSLLCARAFDPLASTDAGAAIAAGDLVLMQGNLSPEATRRMLAEARRRGARTVLNPSPLDGDSAAVPIELADIVVLNREEADRLCGGSDPDAVAGLLARGARLVVLTRGRDGATALSAGAIAHVPAPRVTAIDTAGAGDVFCGTFVGSLDQGSGEGPALALAAAAAALSVTRAGTGAAIPTAREVADLQRALERDPI